MKARVKAAFEFLTANEGMETRRSLHLLQIQTSEVRVDVCVTNKNEKKRSSLTIDVCLSAILIELIAFSSS